MLTVQGWLVDLGKWQPHNFADSTTKPQLLDDKSRLVRFLKGRRADPVRWSASCNHMLTARVLTITGSPPIKVPNNAWELLPLLLNSYPKMNPIPIRNRSLSCTVANIFGSVYFSSVLAICIYSGMVIGGGTGGLHGPRPTHFRFWGSWHFFA